MSAGLRLAFADRRRQATGFEHRLARRFTWIHRQLALVWKAVLWAALFHRAVLSIREPVGQAARRWSNVWTKKEMRFRECLTTYKNDLQESTIDTAIRRTNLRSLRRRTRWLGLPLWSSRNWFQMVSLFEEVRMSGGSMVITRKQFHISRKLQFSCTRLHNSTSLRFGLLRFACGR